MKKTCNQCAKQLKEVPLAEILYCCVNPTCPNYALFQVPLESMPEEEE